MKVFFQDIQIIQVFRVTDNQGQELKVTWNRDNHTEDNPDSIVYIPEFVVEDETGVELEQGCLDWAEAVEAILAWSARFSPNGQVINKEQLSNFKSILSWTK